MREIRKFLCCTAATSAVEFAIVLPVFIIMAFGIIMFGFIMILHSGVQQLAAESARAGIAGLDAGERDRFARAYIDNNIASYPYIQPSVLHVATAEKAGAQPSFEVVLNYDTTGTLAQTLASITGNRETIISKRASVLHGGL